MENTKYQNKLWNLYKFKQKQTDYGNDDGVWYEVKTVVMVVEMAVVVVGGGDDGVW